MNFILRKKLHQAIIDNDSTQVAALIEHNDIDLNNDWHMQNLQFKTPLAIAATCQHDRTEIICYLLKKGADINRTVFHGSTALLASIELHKPTNAANVQCLLENGANPNLQGPFLMTALHKAAIAQDNNSAAIVTLLLTHGANPFLKTQDNASLGIYSNITAIDAAKLYKKTELIALMKNSPYIKLTNFAHPQSLLFMAAKKLADGPPLSQQLLSQIPTRLADVISETQSMKNATPAYTQ